MQITQEQIELAKNKHGKELYLVEVEPLNVGEEKLQYLIKPADRKTMSAAAKIGKSDELKGAEVMLMNCLVLGDKDALMDDKVFFSVISHLEKINEPRKSFLKKI